MRPAVRLTIRDGNGKKITEAGLLDLATPTKPLPRCSPWLASSAALGMVKAFAMPSTPTHHCHHHLLCHHPHHTNTPVTMTSSPTPTSLSNSSATTTMSQLHSNTNSLHLHSSLCQPPQQQQLLHDHLLIPAFTTSGTAGHWQSWAGWLCSYVLYHII